MRRFTVVATDDLKLRDSNTIAWKKGNLYAVEIDKEKKMVQPCMRISA